MEPRRVLEQYFTPGIETFCFFKTSEQKVPVEWRTSIVDKPHSYFLTIITDKNRKTNVAYEDLRLKLNNRSSQELMNGYMEDSIGNESLLGDTKAPGEAVHSPNREIIGNESIADDEPEPNSSIALVSSAKQNMPADKACQDIGTIADKVCNTAEITNCTLKSDRGRIVQDIQFKIGQHQVTAKSLEFVPQWLIEEALEKEMDNNWQGPYLEVTAFSIDRSANVIGSNMVYKVKVGDDAQPVMKARLVLHCNFDEDRFTVRRN